MAYGQFQAPMWQSQYQYPQQFVQPQPIQQMVQPTPSATPIQNNAFIINEFKIVSEDEAKAYIVSPNTRVMLMDRDKSSFCIKSADSLGCSTMEWFKYEKTEHNSQPTKTDELNPNLFVKKDELNNFVDNSKFENSLKTLSDTLNKQLEDINKKLKIQEIMKGDKIDG